MNDNEAPNETVQDVDGHYIKFGFAEPTAPEGASGRFEPVALNGDDTEAHGIHGHFAEPPAPEGVSGHLAPTSSDEDTEGHRFVGI